LMRHSEEKENNQNLPGGPRDGSGG